MSLMRRIQAKLFYRIKRGEAEAAPQVIDNDETGQLLLAFDLKQPWTCHQTYKILDELHADIFARPEVNADRIVGVADIQFAIQKNIADIKNGMLASYRICHYFLLYLFRGALELDEEGLRFCASPGELINEPNGRSRLRASAERIVKDLIIDLNAEVRERAEAGTPFDYKRELKSPRAVRELSHSIIPQFQKAVSRGRACSFGAEWRSTAPRS